jgi:hypothetical protein
MAATILRVRRGRGAEHTGPESFPVGDGQSGKNLVGDEAAVGGTARPDVDRGDAWASAGVASRSSAMLPMLARLERVS